MRELLIYGAGGLGREVAWLARDLGYSTRYVSDTPGPGSTFEMACRHFMDREIVVAVGHPRDRRKLALQAAEAGFKFATLIHPSARIGPGTVIGVGAVICAGVTITVDCVIGQHVLLNLHCTIGHDARIGAHGALMPGVQISGCVTLGEAVYVGTNAAIINGAIGRHLHIGDEATIGAGAVVTRDVPAGETWVGVPAHAKTLPTGQGAERLRAFLET